MTEYTLSAVLIVPAALREKADKLSQAMGHGSPTYTVPLSETGEEPATHYGCRASAIQEFADMINGAQSGEGVPPLDLEAVELIEQDVAEILANLIADFKPASDMMVHCDAVLAENGLQRVVVPA